MTEKSDYKWGDHVLLDCGDSAIIRSNEPWIDPNGNLVICVDHNHYGGGRTTGAVLVSSLRPTSGAAELAMPSNSSDAAQIANPLT